MPITAVNRWGYIVRQYRGSGIPNYEKAHFDWSALDGTTDTKGAMQIGAPTIPETAVKLNGSDVATLVSWLVAKGENRAAAAIMRHLTGDTKLIDEIRSLPEQKEIIFVNTGSLADPRYIFKGQGDEYPHQHRQTSLIESCGQPAQT